MPRADGAPAAPPDKVYTFIKCGIRKGNIATLFPNVYLGIKTDPDRGNAVTEGSTDAKEAGSDISVELWER